MRVRTPELLRAEAPREMLIRCGLTDVCVRNVPVSVVFLYDGELDPETLAHGLARVLGDFAPFHGRLRRRGSERFIECGDTACAFSVVQRAERLTTRLEHLDEALRRSLVDEVDAAAAWSRGGPVFSVRISQFADRRSALGVSWHHTVGDFHSVMRLIKAWSSTVAGRDYAPPLIVEDRDAYLNEVLPTTQAPANLRLLPLRELPRFGAYMLLKAQDKRRITFHFDPAELDAMRASLQVEAGRTLSSNDAISAHMAKIIANWDRPSAGRRLSIAVNIRKRAGLQEHLLGNLVSTLDVPCDPSRSSARLASDVRGALNSFAEWHLNHRANLDLLEHVGGMSKVGRLVPTGVDPFAGSLIFSSWSGFGIYDVDFGIEAPRQFLTASNGPLPWLGVVHEGFGGRGLLFDLELPSALAIRMQSEAARRDVHRYRSSASA